jgi:hypothetical protein
MTIRKLSKINSLNPITETIGRLPETGHMPEKLTTDERLDRIDAQLDRMDKTFESKASKADIDRVFDYLDRTSKRQEISDDEPST